MSISFLINYYQRLEKLRPLKQIEKDLESLEILAEHPLNNKQKEVIATLCLLPRTWISRSISVAYKLRGIQMYEQFEAAIKTIQKMEKKQPHPLLVRLKVMLISSIEGKQSTYTDLKKAHCFLGQLTDILYGKLQQIHNQIQLIRLSEVHRKESSAEQLQQQVEQLIADFQENNKRRSPLCRKISRNFETTYANWKSNIFTCYQYDFIPNDNNSLESNHNKVKRTIRKITGNKSTAHSLLVYGEEFVICQAFYDKPRDAFFSALTEVNFEQVDKRQKQLKIEQQKRGLKIKVVNQTKMILNKAYHDW